MVTAAIVGRHFAKHTGNKVWTQKTGGYAELAPPEAGREAMLFRQPGRTEMSLKFEIQPATNATSEKERTARLADPGFGRIFTDHMAVVRYNQANGWHGARVESRANFPLDPALAVLHYAQEIFE